MQRLPGGNLPRNGRMPMRQMPPKGMGNGMGVGDAMMPGPGGRQLAARVSSGKITQAQAQKTMQQRQTLRKAFGPEWRNKVYGDTGYAQRTRVALAKSPQDAQVGALNTNLLKRRTVMLKAARKRLQEGA